MKEITKDAKLNCIVCGVKGQKLYKNQPDRLFSAEGSWSSRSCKSCGLVWLDPFPSSSDLSPLYEGYYTHGEVNNTFLLEKSPKFEGFPKGKKVKYAILARVYGYVISGMPVKWHKLGGLLSLFPVLRLRAFRGIGGFPAPRKGTRLLDVGCGNGDYLIEMRYLGFNVYGVEIDESAARVARSHGIPVHVGELTEGSHRDMLFDAMYLNNVIEHVPDPLATIKLCFEKLQPGGLLCLRTCSADSLAHTFYKEYYRGLEAPRHLHVFTPRALRRLAVVAGFQVKEARTSYNPYIWDSSRAMKNGDKNAAGAVSGRLYSLLRGIILSLGYFVFSDKGDDIFLLLIKK